MTQGAPSVSIERVIPATPDVVFEAWLDPDVLARFMCGGPGVTVSRVEADARVGGRFLIIMDVAGHLIEHRGEYLAINRHTRLIFTWLSPFAHEGSRVELTFASRGSGTRLTLEHFGLEETEREKHQVGWSHILSLLPASMSTG